MIKIGINGFGRIGRLVLRIIENKRLKNENIEVVGINDPFLEKDHMIYLLYYDTVHGKSNFKLNYNDDNIIVNDKNIKIFSEKNPEMINWKSVDVDIVIESTGVFTTIEKANGHLVGGAKKIIISAPSKDAPMYVMGVNNHLYKNENIISNASCTTNCLAPLARILDEEFGIMEGLMTTIHSTTATQKTVDAPSKDWRSGRASSANIIPASTGAAKAVGKVLPKLDGKITGLAFRVPTINVSVVDFTFKLNMNTSYEKIITSIKKYSDEKLSSIIGYTDDEVVSSDFIGDARSSIIDITAGLALNDNFFKIISWYDNEYGYSNRLVDLAIYINNSEDLISKI